MHDFELLELPSVSPRQKARSTGEVNLASRGGKDARGAALLRTESTPAAIRLAWPRLRRGRPTPKGEPPTPKSEHPRFGASGSRRILSGSDSGGGPSPRNGSHPHRKAGTPDPRRVAPAGSWMAPAGSWMAHDPAREPRIAPALASPTGPAASRNEAMASGDRSGPSAMCSAWIRFSSNS